MINRQETAQQINWDLSKFQSKVKSKLKSLLLKSLYTLGFKKITPFHFYENGWFSEQLGFENAKKFFELECLYHKWIVNEKNPEIREKFYIAFNTAIDRFREIYLPEVDNYGFNSGHILQNKNLFYDKKVIDFGCGYGASTELISQLANFVYGVDCSPICIDKALSSFGHIKNINFQLVKGMRLPYEEGTVDAIYSSDVIEHLHVDDALYHLKEARRVLKSEGTYLLYTPGRNSGPHDITGYFWPKGYGIPSCGSHIKEFTFEELASLFQQAGFSDVIMPDPRADVLVIAKATRK